MEEMYTSGCLYTRHIDNNLILLNVDNILRAESYYRFLAHGLSDSLLKDLLSLTSKILALGS